MCTGQTDFTPIFIYRILYAVCHWFLCCKDTALNFIGQCSVRWVVSGFKCKTCTFGCCLPEIQDTKLLLHWCVNHSRSQGSADPRDILKEEWILSKIFWRRKQAAWICLGFKLLWSWSAQVLNTVAACWWVTVFMHKWCWLQLFAALPCSECCRQGWGALCPHTLPRSHLLEHISPAGYFSNHLSCSRWVANKQRSSSVGCSCGNFFFHVGRSMTKHLYL